MDERDHLRFQLGVLLTAGRELSACVQGESIDPRDVNERYQAWYTQALRLMERVLPERRHEFGSYYQSDQEQRTTISTILGDPMRARPQSEKREALAGLFDPGLEQRTFVHLLGMQLAILASAVPTLLPDEPRPDRTLRTARSLLKGGHARAAGALAGVALEGRLAELARQRDLQVDGRAGWDLSRLNRLLVDAGAYRRERARQIERLAAISAACVHGRKKISAEQVSQLLAGAQKAMRELS